MHSKEKTAQIKGWQMMAKHLRWGFIAGGTCLAAFGLSASAQAADQVVKVGMLLGLSGPAADMGESITRGADLYINLHRQDLPKGVSIQLIKRDDGGNADTAKRLAQELIVRDQVKILAGLTLSPEAFTIAPTITQAKMPTVLMNATTGSITRTSPYFVRFSHANWQMSHTIGVWAGKHGIKHAYSLAADYAAGLDMEAGFERGFKDNGGTIVGSDHTPLSTTDYLPAMERIKAAKPEAVFVFTVSGPGTIATLKAWRDAGLHDAGVKLLGTGDEVPDNQIDETGPAAIDMMSASIYSTALKNPSNIAFIKAFRKAYGEKADPDFTAVAAWNGMEAIFNVVKKYGANFTSDQAMTELKNYKSSDSPSGPISIDPETRDIVQNVYISKVEKVGDHYENVPIETIKDVKDPWKLLNPPKK
jgi:branched-chain amino acid transport system substrate-binding protein